MQPRPFFVIVVFIKIFPSPKDDFCFVVRGAVPEKELITRQT